MATKSTSSDSVYYIITNLEIFSNDHKMIIYLFLFFLFHINVSSFERVPYMYVLMKFPIYKNEQCIDTKFYIGIPNVDAKSLEVMMRYHELEHRNYKKEFYVSRYQPNYYILNPLKITSINDIECMNDHNNDIINITEFQSNLFMRKNNDEFIDTKIRTIFEVSYEHFQSIRQNRNHYENISHRNKTNKYFTDGIMGVMDIELFFS
jgi:hypothetical protein